MLEEKLYFCGFVLRRNLLKIVVFVLYYYPLYLIGWKIVLKLFNMHEKREKYMRDLFIIKKEGSINLTNVSKKRSKERETERVRSIE